MNYLEIVTELNDELINTKFEDYYSFSFHTNGYVDSIILWLDGSEIILWCSEYDECSTDYSDCGCDGDYDKEFFITWLVRQVSAMSDLLSEMYNALNG